MNLLSQHLMEKQPISNSQWSFQRVKSTVTALLENTHNCFEMLERGKEVGAVSVPHHALLENLRVDSLLVK